MRLFITALMAAVASTKYSPDTTTPEWIALSAQEKHDGLWDKITADTSMGDWHLAGLLFEGMDEVFSSPGDEFPCKWDGCRNKDIHSRGDVAKVKFVSNGQGNFTGMFSKDADYGFLRLSVAAGEPNPDKQLLLPGMGLKFLRDGIDSANLVSMYSVDGQPSFNFFENDWNTIIPSASLALYPVAAKFYTATKYIQVCGLSDFATYDQEGNATEDPIFPFRIRFEPTGAIEFSSTVYTDYREQLATIPVGTDLFRLHAMTAPEELGGEEIYIGDLVTQSEMTTSNFGDEHLYIRHQKADDDILLRPEWESYYPVFDPLHPVPDSDMSKFLGEELEDQSSKCPFAELMNYITQ